MKTWKLSFAAMAAGGALIVAAPAISAQQAPPGEAEAVAAEIEGIAAIAATGASAGPDGTAATANAVELGGEPPSEQFGGTQEGSGSSSGALFDTGDSELGRLALTPWSASADEQSAVAEAALARLRVSDVASVDVLQSSADASYEDTGSAGSSSSDGAVVNLGGEGGLTIVVLHAETSSSGEASSYLLAVNDDRIATSDESDGACLIEIPDLVSITCLRASGGTAGDEATPFEAAVLEAVVGGDEGLLAGIVTAGSAGGAATGAAGAAGAADTGDEGALPRTGAEATALTGVALVLLAAGRALGQLRRRAGVAT